MLDLRTQEGRYARDICDGIAADLGGAPNAAQQILCQMFALKVLRVQLLVKTILSGETVNQHTENYALGWMNSARRDCAASSCSSVISAGGMLNSAVGVDDAQQRQRIFRAIALCCTQYGLGREPAPGG